MVHQVVNTSLDDKVLTEEEEGQVTAFFDAWGLTEEERSRDRAMYRLSMAAALRDVLEGKVPKRLQFTGQLSFNLQKSEELVWLFLNTKFYEERVHRERVGGYQGASIRIAKGVYYHTGGFRGHTIESASMDLIDTGTLGVTTKHLYFAGPRKAFRVPYTKVVNFTPYSDGIGIFKDSTSAKPQSFVTGDGWFVYNLVVNLSHLQESN